MNFGKTDMYILVGSFMVIVFMSLVFPALGMTDDHANESNVPSLDITKNTVDWAGERPEYPSSPTSGTLEYERGNPTEMRQSKLKENGDNEVFLETYCDNDYADPANDSCYFTLTVFDSGNVDSDSYTLSKSDFNDSKIVTLEADNNNSQTWKVSGEMAYQKNWNNTDITYAIEWEILDSPDTSGIESVPVIGSIYATADAVASVLAWGITVFMWGSIWFVELVFNVLSLLVTLFFFMIDLVTYMTGNYNGMINSVSGFATFILLFPVILLTVEFLKLGFIFIKLLPTT